MAKKTAKRKAADPLSNVRIEPPRSAEQLKSDAEQALSDAASEAEVAAEDAPSVAETAATAARVRAEKKVVAAPPKARKKQLPRYKVLADQTVTWRGQALRLKGGKSIVGDEKQGPGAVEKFRLMGVKLEELKD